MEWTTPEVEIARKAVQLSPEDRTYLRKTWLAVSIMTSLMIVSQAVIAERYAQHFVIQSSSTVRHGIEAQNIIHQNVMQEPSHKAQPLSAVQDASSAASSSTSTSSSMESTTKHKESNAPGAANKLGLPKGSSCPAPQATVDRLIRHWFGRAETHLAKLRSGRKAADGLASPDVGDLMKSMGLAAASDFCYAKFVFNGSAVRMAEDFRQHCHNRGLAASSAMRGRLYSAVWTHLLREHASEAASWAPFSWVMDLTSGSRFNPELRRALQLPTLVPASNPKDDTVVLVPDAFMLMGTLYNTSLQHLIPHHVHHAAEGYYGKYHAGPASAPPWEKKIPKAIFRGSCHPTINSSSARSHVRVPVRSYLCESYGLNHSLFDIGVYTEGSASPCSTEAGMNKYDWCQQCGGCSGKKQEPVKEQMRFKYQLLVDGHGPAYDANLWKLLSGSTCFQVNADQRRGEPLFEMVYYPLLTPHGHYIPAAMSELGEAVAWCKEHDQECATMGEKARSVMHCFIRNEVVLGYLWAVLKRLHDFHFGDGDR